MTDRSNVLITGASSGIGAACAELLAKRGWAVWGTSRKPRTDEAGINWLEMDVCQDVSVERGVAAMLAAEGRIDAVVCNAGFGIFGSVEDVSMEKARAQLETNFFGVLRVLRAVLPSMRKARAGRILVVGSLSGRAPIPYQAHYSASKAALDALTLSLRNEVAHLHIHVSLIEPGDIATPFNDALLWDAVPRTLEYSTGLQRCESVIRRSLPEAPPPTVVAKCVARALSAKRPRVRYTVGAESALVPFGRRLLPDRLMLRLIRRHFDLP